MIIYNTKTLHLEEFKPIKENEVKIYVCGPTVYNDVHIGNIRPVVVFDTLRRVFEEQGYQVYYVSNYTDVDDKIIKEAKKRMISEKVLTDQMIDAYNDIRHALNAEDLYKAPRVTETMDDIIYFIEELVNKGAAYVVDGDVYFRTNSIPSYGSLSNQNIDELKFGARIEENDKKESPLDFALWKKTDTGIRWQSPFSLGRPGWHTECVVMIDKNLGETIDIHGGGKDLRFPHHENERAQAIACYGKELANYWMHSGMIDIDGVKMSKSLGNFITAKDILKKVDPMVLRWFLLATHYRQDVNVSDEIIDNAKKELDRILSALKHAEIKLSYHDIKETIDRENYAHFMAEMNNDLNTANAYTCLFEMTKKLNNALRMKEIDYNYIASLTGTIKHCLNILGIKVATLYLSDDDKKLIAQWENAKQEKKYDEADKLRLILNEKGLL